VHPEDQHYYPRTSPSHHDDPAAAASADVVVAGADVVLVAFANHDETASCAAPGLLRHSPKRTLLLPIYIRELCARKEFAEAVTVSKCLSGDVWS